MAPKITDYLKKDSKEFYRKVCEYLNILEVNYTEDSTMVGYADYYTHTVWQFTLNDEEKPTELGLGGRYDDMAKIL